MSTPRYFLTFLRRHFDGAGSGHECTFQRSSVSSFRFLGNSMVIFVVLCTVLIFAPASLASCPTPQFEQEPYEEEIHSTRVHVEAHVVDETCLFGWHAYYSTSESGPWTEVSGKSENEYEGNFLPLGAPVPLRQPELQHLKPSTPYYARWVVKNSEGKEATKILRFTTDPIAAPEIPLSGVAELPDFVRTELTKTSAAFRALIETNGAVTKYQFEYAPSEAGPWSPFTSEFFEEGTITVAEDFAAPEAHVTGLAPETTYFVRVKASNEKGDVIQTKYLGEFGEASSFTTNTAKPKVSRPGIRNATGTSAQVVGRVEPNGEETHWHVEYATSQSVLEQGHGIHGPEGTIPQAEAEALGENGGAEIEAAVAGLDPATTYYVRLVVQSSTGTGQSSAATFKTAGPPTALTLATHALHGEALRLLAAVDPESVPTSEEQTITVNGAPTGGTFTLTFAGQTTTPIAYNAPASGPGSVEVALQALANKPVISVKGSKGVDTVRFYGRDAEIDQPQITADASGLTPSGSVVVATTQQGGEGYDTHYHFEYVAQEQYEKTGGEGGFTKALSTSEVDVGTGDATKFVGQDLPTLTAGETYHYRVVATNTSPGDPVVLGEEQTLTAPTPAPAQEAAACPNASYRTGPSANLPDCRAYEQLTPPDKEGAQEIADYLGALIRGSHVGADGNHVVFEDDRTVSWGSGPDAGQGPYFFSRAEGKGWQTTAGAAQPETGVNVIDYEQQLYSADLTRIALRSAFQTSADGGGGQSAAFQFSVGPPGGPYVNVASVPRTQLGKGGWAAGTPDLSTLILQLEDHTLLGHATGTLSGPDLYEYAGGELRQANVNSEGKKLGTCGAHIVNGDEGEEEAGGFRISTPHALSVDGARLFFEAVPGSNCSAQSNLYMRENGENTVDIGAYHFLAANAEGSEVLLEKHEGESRQVFLYNMQTQAASLLFSLPNEQITIRVSEDLTALYFGSRQQLVGTQAPPISDALGSSASVQNIYRYDVPSRTLSFVIQAGNPLRDQITPDGRYFYFQAETIAGVPGSGVRLGSEPNYQIYRYDNSTRTIQCMSCASSFDPEPRLTSFFSESTAPGRSDTPNGSPPLTLVSGDGRYAFFYTAAALVPSDVDGEIPQETTNGEDRNAYFSPSTDVYEWRADAVDGCSHLQGCLALITSGRGGYLNNLIGTADEGHDVFFTTASQLVPQDKDTALDIYDARVGGGFPSPPPQPVECEGDACATPGSPPNDATPSSFTFQGAGNALQTPLPKPAGVKPRAPKTKKQMAGKKKSKKKGKARKESGKSAMRRNKAKKSSGVSK